jgi:hypothetical protein
MPGQFKIPKTSRSRIEKVTGRELARLIYNDQRNEESRYFEVKKKKLIEEGLNNIKEHCLHNCVYCNEFVDFTNHREDRINGAFFWIAECPKCGKTNYQNIFIRIWRDPDTGQKEPIVDTKWLTEAQLRSQAPPEEPRYEYTPQPEPVDYPDTDEPDTGNEGSPF